MRIIVDGYNVLKKIYHDEFIDDFKRLQFLNQLHYYGKKRGHEIVVVFDGGTFSYPSKELHKEVMVIYAGANRSADDYIKEYVTFKRGDQLLVSSDRQLCSSVAEHQVVSIDAHVFYIIMQEALSPAQDQSPKSKEGIRKISVEADVDLDNIMKEASKFIQPKKEDLSEATPEKTRKMTKLEKKLYNIIKKL